MSAERKVLRDGRDGRFWSRGRWRHWPTSHFPAPGEILFHCDDCGERISMYVTLEVRPARQAVTA